MRKLAALALLALLWVSLFAGAQNLEGPIYLFTGNTGVAILDTVEQASPWIKVQGAQRILIRTWSGRAAFAAASDPDSTYSDSIAVFKVGFTDSIVAGSIPAIAGDSVVITTATVANVDTATKMVGVFQPPLQEALRGPSNGSGVVTWVVPITPGLAVADGNGVIEPKYMRVYYTPFRRMTVTGSQSTQGKRTVGLKNLRMTALIYKANR